MGDSYLTAKIKVDTDSGKSITLTMSDCLNVINTLLHHRMLQFDVDLDRKLMGRPIEQWESAGVWGETGNCFQYEGDFQCLTISVSLQDSHAIGGLPREEFRNKPNTPDPSNN